MSASELDALCRAAEGHGVLPLLAERLLAWSDLETGQQRRLRDCAQQAAAVDLVRERELRAVLAAGAENGLQAVLLKGAHLAYTVYPRADLRPRLDTDLLIAERERDDAAAVLRSLGYEPARQSGGDLLMYQQPYLRRDASGIQHTVDVHWRLANPQRFGAVLSHDEIWRAATPLPRLGPGARGPAASHALLIACVHRVAHHYDTTRLIWTYDIHVIAGMLDPDGWAAFAKLAVERQVALVCARGLALSRDLFGTAIGIDPATLVAAGAVEDDTAQYFETGARHLDRIAADFRALSWSARCRLARQHLFPSASYMRGVYAPASSAPLALLYARRAWRGARRWLARS
jgi:hypothetical protein